MLISEVPEKHPKLISKFEKETGTKAILKNGKITGQFKHWLQQKINEKNGQSINNPLLKFFLNFLNEHHYFSKKLLVFNYIQKAQPPVDEFDDIRKKFGTIIRQHVKYGVLEYYSVHNFKINKIVLEKIVNMSLNKARVEV